MSDWISEIFSYWQLQYVNKTVAVEKFQYVLE